MTGPLIGPTGASKHPNTVLDATGRPVPLNRYPTVVDSPALRARSWLESEAFLVAFGIGLAILGIVAWAAMLRSPLVHHLFSLPFGEHLATVLPAAWWLGPGALFMLRKDREACRLATAMTAVLFGVSGFLGQASRQDFWEHFWHGGLLGTALSALPGGSIVATLAILAGFGYLAHPAAVYLAARRQARATPPPPPPHPQDQCDHEHNQQLRLAPVGGWELPRADLLRLPPPASSLDVAPLQAEMAGALSKLAIPGATIVGNHVGPSTVRFDVAVGAAADLDGKERALRFITGEESLRIQLPVGKSLAAIEFPSPVRQLVTLGDTLRRLPLRGTHALTVPLGQDVYGKPVPINLQAGPHYLLAGETGSGKSYCMHALITGLLMRCSPEMARIILVDPKRSGFSIYRGLPHLLTPVINTPADALRAFSSEIAEMESRYELIDNAGFDELDDYNASRSEEDRLPYHLLFIDELADLIQTSRQETEDAIARLVALGRAAGVHLIAATQQPVVQVVTSVIKANFASRIAFRVVNATNSRVALGESGAEHLLGQGDAFFKPSGVQARRVQVALVTREEIREVVACWANQAPDLPDGDGGNNGNNANHGPEVTKPAGLALVPPVKTDDRWGEAVDLATRYHNAGTRLSVVAIQKKLGMGFPRASRLHDQLREEGLL